MTHIHIKGKKSWKRLDIAESGGSKDLYIFVLLLFAQNFYLCKKLNAYKKYIWKFFQHRLKNVSFYN